MKIFNKKNWFRQSDLFVFSAFWALEHIALAERDMPFIKKVSTFLRPATPSFVLCEFYCKEYIFATTYKKIHLVKYNCKNAIWKKTII